MEIACDIDGVLIRKLEKHSDERGWLCELFRKDEINEENTPVMAYMSLTGAGVARGPHEHRLQTDYICFTGQSRFKVYLWDNRPQSATYGRQHIFEAVEDVPVAVKIPPGVVHGYKNIGSVEGIIFNAPDKLYAGSGRREAVDEIRYENLNDSKFRIDD